MYRCSRLFNSNGVDRISRIQRWVGLDWVGFGSGLGHGGHFDVFSAGIGSGVMTISHDGQKGGNRWNNGGWGIGRVDGYL